MMNAVQFQGVVIQKRQGKFNTLKNRLFPESTWNFRNVASRNLAENKFGIEGATISISRPSSYTTLFGPEVEKYRIALKDAVWPEKRREMRAAQDAMVKQIVDDCEDVQTIDITV